jgi:fused signal recognition particle receptor
MFKFWKKKSPTPAPEGEAALAPPAGTDPAALESPAGTAGVEAALSPPPPAAEATVAGATPGLADAASVPEALPPAQVESGVGASEEPVAVLAPEPAVSAAPAGWRERLRQSTFARSLGGLFRRNPKLDEDLLEELETCLLSGDVGVAATTALIEDLRKRMNRREFADARALLGALRADLLAMLAPVAQPLRIDATARPFTILVVGVNGVGKTTTIGKLAHRYKAQGLDLLLAAGDTFRAAAVEQLKTWGQRNGVPVVAQGQGSDSASVIFDALQAGRARDADLLIADTAGRLHTQSGLMDELGKIKRVLGKLDASAPQEVLLVIDGTTGQNAISQLRLFHKAVGVTGLVVTKLDGSAKGGVIFALAREFGLPLRFVGLGEKAEDLREFDPAAFVDALLPERLDA